MNKIATAAIVLLAFPLAGLTGGCSSPNENAAVPGEEEVGDDGQVSSAVTETPDHCFCTGRFACGHSSSPSFMFPAAHRAIESAGVPDSQLIQTFGDAAASVGTHCPEPGTSTSAATDVTPSSSPCGRVHRLRMAGFAAWYRVPPSFSFHIHAVWAAAPVLKSSLKSQIASFLEGRNGLANNAVETTCPISTAEKNAVRDARDGHPPSGGETCVPGGDYCGGDKVSGSSSSLYNCDADGKGATKIRDCKHGCRVESGTDDACRCSPGGVYCGGDQVSGSSSTLFRCGSDGVSTSVVKHCANGCAVHSGSDDACK